MDYKQAKITFFGGEPLGVPTLEELHVSGITPNLVVCNPDRPAGRGQQLTAPPVKIWAENNNVPTFQPTSYKEPSELSRLTETEWDLFIVVAYNFILPQWLLDIPKRGVINVHPSLLPKLRGASPIRTAIKDDLRDAVGVTIMQMDEQMDHGPIIAQAPMPISDENWPVSGPELDTALAHMGGALLATTIPDWLAGTLTPTEQDHDQATYCSRFQKADAKLDIDPLQLPAGQAALSALLHINAWCGIGDSFFEYNNVRVKIKQATLAPDNSLQLLRVTPAGKPEMDFAQYLQSLA